MFPFISFKFRIIFLKLFQNALYFLLVNINNTCSLSAKANMKIFEQSLLELSSRANYFIFNVIYKRVYETDVMQRPGTEKDYT